MQSLWRLFSLLEGRESDLGEGAEEEIKKACVKQLQDAAARYSESLKEVGSTMVEDLTPSEIELAGVLPSFPYPTPYGLDVFRRPFRLGEQYRELANRIRILASEISTIDTKNDRRDLAPQVFRAMTEWEIISTIARIIAVANRRSSPDH